MKYTLENIQNNIYRNLARQWFMLSTIFPDTEVISTDDVGREARNIKSLNLGLELYVRFISEFGSPLNPCCSACLSSDQGSEGMQKPPIEFCGGIYRTSDKTITLHQVSIENRVPRMYRTPKPKKVYRCLTRAPGIEYGEEASFL
jgi:hypothetical protein